MAQGSRVQLQEDLLPLGDRPAPEAVVGAQVADRLLPVPEAGDQLCASHLSVLPGKQHRVVQARYARFAGEHKLRGRAGKHRQPRLSLVARLSGLIRAERASNLVGLVGSEPETEALEPEPTAAQLDGAPAQGIEVGCGGQLEADVVQGGKLAAEAMLLVPTLAERLLRPESDAEVTNRGGV